MLIDTSSAVAPGRFKTPGLRGARAHTARLKNETQRGLEQSADSLALPALTKTDAANARSSKRPAEADANGAQKRSRGVTHALQSPFQSLANLEPFDALRPQAEHVSLLRSAAIEPRLTSPSSSADETIHTAVLDDRRSSASLELPHCPSADLTPRIPLPAFERFERLHLREFFASLTPVAARSSTPQASNTNRPVLHVPKLAGQTSALLAHSKASAPINHVSDETLRHIAAQRQQRWQATSRPIRAEVPANFPGPEFAGE